MIPRRTSFMTAGSPMARRWRARPGPQAAGDGAGEEPAGGLGLGSSACSVVAALEGLNAFHGAPLNEHDMLLLMGRWKGKISGSVPRYDNVAPCYLGACSWCWKSTASSARAFRCLSSGTGWSATRHRGLHRRRRAILPGPISPSGLPHLRSSPGGLRARQLQGRRVGGQRIEGRDRRTLPCGAD